MRAAVGEPLERTGMIGLVIVTHGRLAEEFVLAMEHVVGPQSAVEAICIGPEDDMEKRRQDILDACNRVNAGSGVILLTDMFGGTPSNLAISVMRKGAVEVVAGVNLPMLIKLASVRSAGSGLHARASARFVKTAEQFQSDVRVTKDGQTVEGTSIMGLMTLAAAP